MLKSARRTPSGAGSDLEALQLLHRSGKLDQAISGLEELVAAQPKSARLRVTLSDWLIEAGRNEEAIETLFALQELLIASGNPLAAISAGVKIVELDPAFDNPLSFVAKVNASRLREERAKDHQGAAERSAEPDSTSPQMEALSNIPLLSELGPDELASVAHGLKRRLLSPGAVVFAQGDSSRSLSFVVQGLLEIRTDERKLDTAAAGQCLGEFAFLTGQPRTASVVAVEESEVLELPYDAMLSVVASHPRVRTVLDRMYHGRVLARVLAESPLFEFLDAGERHRIASRFELMRVPHGIRIVEVGAEDGSLFLVKRGAVEIRNASDQVLGAIGPNEFFGEVSFLTGVPRTASATTTEDSELLRIDRDALTELAVEHPRLVEVLKKFHLDRVQNAMQIAKASARA